MSQSRRRKSFKSRLESQERRQTIIESVRDKKSEEIMNKYNVLLQDKYRDKYARSHCNKLANESYGKTDGKWCYPPFTEHGINKPFTPWAKKRAESRESICNECTKETSDKLFAELTEKRNIKTYMQFGEDKYGGIDEKYKNQFGAVKRIFGGSRTSRMRGRGSERSGSKSRGRKTRK